MKVWKYNSFSGIVLTASGLLLAACGHGLPSRLDHMPADLSNPALKASGIYSDGWAGEIGSVTLEQPGSAQVLSIRGTVPMVSNPTFRSEIELQLDNKTIGHWNVGLGDFALSSPIATGAGARRVTVAFTKSQELPGDGRLVGARLSFLGFESKPAKASAPSDIVRSTNLQLGSGWGTLETFHNENFRWVDNDARFVFTPGQTGNAEVSLTAEPGPGLEAKSFVLRVLDASGRQVSAEPVDKRRTPVKFLLPVEAGKPNEFRLHVDGGGKPAPNDPRVLNFRVFQMQAADWKEAK